MRPNIASPFSLRTYLTALQAVLLALKGLAHLGNDAFVNVVTDVCKLAKACNFISRKKFPLT